MYVSATGATKVSNLCYANRFGLWQTGDFPFSSREDFVSSIESGGIAAMEVVSRDLKGLGMYLARSLSFEGVEYETLEVKLSETQEEIYDSYEALALRDKLIDKLASLDPIPGALDQLLWHFGHEKVVEVTGRSRRVLKDKTTGRLFVDSRGSGANHYLKNS